MRPFSERKKSRSLPLRTKSKRKRLTIKNRMMISSMTMRLLVAVEKRKKSR